METLLQHLQGTIRALESLIDKGLPDSDRLDELLDQLFQQKIDLVNLTPNTGSPAYQQAAQALSQAASRAQKAVKDPAQLKEVIAAVTDAAGKLSKLLNNTAG